MDIEQNPRNKKHLILCTRDYNAGGGYVFETFDYGENWHRNDEIPYLAACSKIKFHPSCDLVFLASPMGTLVYDWSERIYKTEPYISENTYGSITKTFSISGNIGTKNAYAPISLVLECDGAVKYFYFDYADELGYFSFKVPGIEDEKNEYTAKINAQGLETELQYSFQTPYEEPYDGEKPKAYYDSATGNIIITGKDNRKISETAFAGAVIATKSGESILGMTQSIIRPDGNYVLKMKIDSDAKTEDLNAVVTLYAGISFKIDIFNNTLPQYDYNTDVKVLSDTFRANIDFKYFFADKMNILAIAVCHGNDRQILSTSVKRQTFDYLPEQIEICENIPDNTFTLEVFVWDSETYKPLGSKTFISIKENNNG